MSDTRRNIRPRINRTYPNRWNKINPDTSCHTDKNGVPDPSTYHCESMKHMQNANRANHRCSRSCGYCYPRQSIEERTVRQNFKEQVNEQDST